jgi:hypothetical protein
MVGLFGQGKESYLGVGSTKAPNEGVASLDEGLCALFSITGPTELRWSERAVTIE